MNAHVNKLHRDLDIDSFQRRARWPSLKADLLNRAAT